MAMVFDFTTAQPAAEPAAEPVPEAAVEAETPPTSASAEVAAALPLAAEVEAAAEVPPADGAVTSGPVSEEIAAAVPAELAPSAGVAVEIPVAMPAMAAMDEKAKPFGGEPEVEQAQDFSSEPLEARLGSKDINRRCSAYTELQSAMETGSDAEAFTMFWKHLTVCVGETLPKGQDAALSALAMYLSRCENPEPAEVLALVRKLVEHKSIDKPKMQQLVPPVVLAVVEICEGPAVVKELLECLTDLEGAKKKVQGFFKKQVAFIIRLFFQMLAEFGPAKLNPKLGYVQIAVKYVTEKELGIREACYSVLVELSCWLGDISSLVQAMEEPQRKELTTKVEKLPEDERRRGAAKRRYRGEKVEEPSAAQAKGAQAGPQTACVVSLDPYDMLEAVDAQKKLPKGWCIDKVFGMEKWKEKHNYLILLSTALDAPRLVPCELFGSWTSSFVRIIKTESNIPIMAEACKCVGFMARGLRKDYERPARQLFPVAIKRITDKSVWKQNVLIDMVEQLLWSLPYEPFFEEVRPFVASKSLFAKKEAMTLLQRSFGFTQVQQNCGDVAQKFFCLLAAAVLPNIDDNDNTVRQDAAKLLAILAHRNASSPDLGPHLLSKVPATRRNFFEEEYRRVGKELGVACELPACAEASEPCTAEAPSAPAPVRGAAASEGRPQSPARGRPASPRLQRPASPRTNTGMTAPRARGLALVPRSQSRQASAERSNASAPAAPPARVVDTEDGEPSAAVAAAAPAPASGADAGMIEAMAEEIRNLNAKVLELQAQQAEQAQAPPQNPQMQPAAAAAEVSTRARPVRQMTPPPQRPRSSDRRQTPTRQAAAESQVERRYSTGSACESPAPTKRSSTRSSAVPRAASQDSLALPMKIDPPKQGKVVRQLRERSQYWGPDQIPAEYLANLKENFKAVVDANLCRQMFSEKMDEQLQAMQCWKRQIPTNFGKVVEVFDMVLKWLTWNLFNTNTQVFKLTLEVIGCMLERLAAEGRELTEREAQILVPNIVERSGHNNPSIRESMMVVLPQILQVYSRPRMLPMLLHGLTSKNKRSANCSLRAIADCCDRVVAVQVLKSQKDVATIGKMLDDKDTELRKAALHVLALLSQHAAPDAFERNCGKCLSKDALTAVRTAAAKLPPVATGDGDSSLETSQANVSYSEQASVGRAREATPPRRVAASSGSTASDARAPRETQTRDPTPPKRSSAAAGDARATRDSTPTRRDVIANTAAEARAGRDVVPSKRDGSGRDSTPQRAVLSKRESTPERKKPAVPEASPSRMRTPTPTRTSRGTASEKLREPAEMGTPRGRVQTVLKSPSPSPITMQPTPSPAPNAQSSFAALLGRLVAADADTKAFQESCEAVIATIKEQPSNILFDSEDFTKLGHALLSLSRSNISATSEPQVIEERGAATVQLMDIFAGRQECRMSSHLPHELVVSLMREQLRALQGTGLGKDIMEKLNKCFVKFIVTGLAPFTSYWALLMILTEDGADKRLSLVAKCIKKVIKFHVKEGCADEVAEAEARRTVEVVLGFSSKVTNLPEKLQKAWIDGAKDIVEAGRRWSSKAAEQRLADAVATAPTEPEHRLLEELLGGASAEQSLLQYLPDTKENMPVGPEAAAITKPNARKSCPAAGARPTPSSPCSARNA